MGNNKNNSIDNSYKFDKDLLNNAQYIISYFSKNDKEITNLKLQKLLYFMEAIYMVITNENALFNEEFYAWNFGPVNDVVYNKYKTFGRMPILPDENIVIPDGNVKYIKILFDLFGDYSSYQLVALSHLPGSPWHDIYVNYGEGDIPDYEIVEKEKTKIWFKTSVVDIEDGDYES